MKVDGYGYCINYKTGLSEGSWIDISGDRVVSSEVDKVLPIRQGCVN